MLKLIQLSKSFIAEVTKAEVKIYGRNGSSEA
jgi:hypothetical protein